MHKLIYKSLILTYIYVDFRLIEKFITFSSLKNTYEEVYPSKSLMWFRNLLQVF